MEFSFTLWAIKSHWLIITLFTGHLYKYSLSKSNTNTFILKVSVTTKNVSRKNDLLDELHSLLALVMITINYQQNYGCSIQWAEDSKCFQ